MLWVGTATQAPAMTVEEVCRNVTAFSGLARAQQLLYVLGECLCCWGGGGGGGRGVPNTPGRPCAYMCICSAHSEHGHERWLGHSSFTLDRRGVVVRETQDPEDPPERGRGKLLHLHALAERGPKKFRNPIAGNSIPLCFHKHVHG